MLIAASALVIFALGTLHLVFTYRGRRFYPRDALLEARMKEVSPVISRQTTMWRAGIGFHASHSFGAILFGLIYMYLALDGPRFLFKSPFLLILGLAYLCAFVVLAKLFSGDRDRQALNKAGYLDRCSGRCRQRRGRVVDRFWRNNKS
jgi:hypothetical protein